MQGVKSTWFSLLAWLMREGGLAPSRGEDGAAGTQSILFTHPRCDWIYCQCEEDKLITSAQHSIGRSKIC